MTATPPPQAQNTIPVSLPQAAQLKTLPQAELRPTIAANTKTKRLTEAQLHGALVVDGNTAYISVPKLFGPDEAEVMHLMFDLSRTRNYHDSCIGCDLNGRVDEWYPQTFPLHMPASEENEIRIGGIRVHNLTLQVRTNVDASGQFFVGWNHWDLDDEYATFVLRVPDTSENSVAIPRFSYSVKVKVFVAVAEDRITYAEFGHWTSRNALGDSPITFVCYTTLAAQTTHNRSGCLSVGLPFFFKEDPLRVCASMPTCEHAHCDMFGCVLCPNAWEWGIVFDDSYLPRSRSLEQSKYSCKRVTHHITTFSFPGQFVPRGSASTDLDYFVFQFEEWMHFPAFVLVALLIAIGFSKANDAGIVGKAYSALCRRTKEEEKKGT